MVLAALKHFSSNKSTEHFVNSLCIGVNTASGEKKAACCLRKGSVYVSVSTPANFPIYLHTTKYSVLLFGQHSAGTQLPRSLLLLSPQHDSEIFYSSEIASCVISYIFVHGQAHSHTLMQSFGWTTLHSYLTILFQSPKLNHYEQEPLEKKVIYRYKKLKIY